MKSVTVQDYRDLRSRATKAERELRVAEAEIRRLRRRIVQQQLSGLGALPHLGEVSDLKGTLLR